MEDQLTWKDATAQAELVRQGVASPQELVEAAIERIDRCNPALNAVIYRRFARAREEAAGPLPDGPFRGVPILLKDLGATQAGEPYCEGTAFARAAGYRADQDSYLVQRFRKAGFVVLGRTNTPELGTTITTEPLAFGATRNPWNTEHSTGGSSGGSAAAVASGMVPVAHASDGGGSIRVPASCCALFGLKPSRGRVSKGPAPAEAWFGASVDHVETRTRSRLGGRPRRDRRLPPGRHVSRTAAGPAVCRRGPRQSRQAADRAPRAAGPERLLVRPGVCAGGPADRPAARVPRAQGRDRPPGVPGGARLPAPLHRPRRDRGRRRPLALVGASRAGDSRRGVRADEHAVRHARSVDQRS